MSIVFWEGRKTPTSVRNQFAGFGYDNTADIAKVVASVSPWDFLKGVFVDKPLAQAQAQAAIAQTQAQTASAYQQNKADEQQQTLRTALMVGGGVLGVLLLVSLLRRPARAVGGYKSRRRSKRRSHR